MTGTTKADQLRALRERQTDEHSKVQEGARRSKKAVERLRKAAAAVKRGKARKAKRW